jgi:hypothetical protein
LITASRFRIVLFCLMIAGLGGCASTGNVIGFEQSNMNVPIKMLVMESPVSIEPGRLQAVLAPDVKPGSPVPEGLIAQGEKHAREYALTSMQDALDK